MKCFRADFYNFLVQLSKFSFCVGQVEHLPLIPSIFWIFLSLKSFDNSWGNFNIHSMVIIFQFRFTCDERELCKNVKRFQVFWTRLYQENVLRGIFNSIKTLCLQPKGFILRSLDNLNVVCIKPNFCSFKIINWWADLFSEIFVQNIQSKGRALKSGMMNLLMLTCHNFSFLNDIY